MKHLAYVLILVLAFSCKDNQKEKVETTVETTTHTETSTQNTEKNTETTADLPFLKDIKSLEKDKSANPIEAFKTKATNIATEVVKLNKDNIKDALAKAKDFKNVVITVDNHTIVKLDVNDCKPSSAWSACMPKAEGYIKKGDLVYQNDYANNIIGLPDGQERLLFLFD
ncbi:hypothetical protein C7H62_1117 [Mesoflavibacter sp. HG96]|uniref:Uncharacterized protein n=1 Tax=Mesoflavibacter profundi TaxID=2708110 RepID=A0ABT4S2F4_9FLAO|nr:MULTISPECIES: hypothetical protein [Mesoflavibacter]MDA0177966.1 hypothetical protein [Mesoflavibacter profundi]QIJ88926.1 hypothetical protein C7H62_1117 [Mesoflavibacter sp. HG96]QIJ91654.1 hypothetical protein C7H56_1117 [Mesoflavibacter sp. HG37]